MLDCPRLYIYSDTDELVSAHWVDEHVADAKQKGVDVSVEKYGTSAHVSHARTDGKRCVTGTSLTQPVLSQILDIGLLSNSTGRIAHQPEDRAATTVHILA